MEKLLKPPKLAIDPNEVSAAKEWKHWVRTFRSYMNRYVVSSPELADAEMLEALNSLATADVYEYVENCETYDQAERLLQKLYVKEPNEVFARFRLSNAKQESNQSLAEFKRNLIKLSKDCNFKAVTATNNCEDMLRDAFISGISSNDIRQRLLENKKLTWTEAYEQAVILDEAKRNSVSFSSKSFVDSQVIASANVPSSKVAANVFPGVCNSCGGNQRHDFKTCPAKSLICYK